MVKAAVGENAFHGKGVPQIFMTDNCDALKNALAATWPSAQQFLCIFHLLQQVWRWLLDSKHGISKENRQKMMSVAQHLVYATARDDFNSVWEKFMADPLAEKYPNFLR